MQMTDLERRRFWSHLRVLTGRIPGLTIDESKGPDAAVAELATALHLSQKAVQDVGYYGVPTKEFREAALAEQERVTAEAGAVADQMRTPDGRKGLWQRARDAAIKGMAEVFGSVDRLPVPDSMKQALKAFGGRQTWINVAGDTYTGTEEGKAFRGRMDKLHETVKGSVPTERNLFSEAITSLLSHSSASGALDAAAATATRTRISEMRRLTGREDLGEAYLATLDKAAELWKEQAIKDFVKAEKANLHNLYVEGKRLGVFTRDEKENYFPNMVKVVYDQYRDPIEKMLFKNKMSASDFTKTKQFTSGIDAALAGFTPVSLRAEDLMTHYHDAMGRRFAMKDLKSKIAANVDDWTISPHPDVQESAFIIGEPGGDIPQTADKQRYVNMGSVARSLEGYYAHPLVFKQWGRKVFDHISYDGFMGSARSLLETSKAIHFGFDFFHMGTVVKKSFELGGAFRFLINPFSVMRSGNDALESHHPVLLELAERGATFSRDQYARELFSQFEYDEITGKRRVNLWKQIASMGGLATKSSDFIFGTVVPGLKAGMALRIAESETFRRWETMEGGGREYALNNLATLLNNHFGGQNFAAMGRSKLAQAFLQAALLAPDFQESMWRRNFGIVHPDPELRAVYQASIGIQAAVVISMTLVLQKLYDELRGETRTPESWLHDSVGHWLDIQIDTKADGKKIYISPWGSEKETFRPIMALANSYYGAALGRDITGKEFEYKNDVFLRQVLMPVMKDIGHELKNKGSPLAREVQSWMERAERSKKPEVIIPGVLNKPESMFDLPWMPISLQPLWYSALGGFGDLPEDRAHYMAISLITSLTGTPISEGRKPEKKKLAILK